MHVRSASASELTIISRWYLVHLGQTMTTADLSAVLGSEKDILWVVERAGSVCAFLHAVWSGGPYELLGLVVDSGQRRKGIGVHLMQSLLSELSSHKSYELWLEVRRDNEAARRLYRSMGAKETGVRSNYYSDGMDAILMTYSSEAETSGSGADSGSGG